MFCILASDITARRLLRFECFENDFGDFGEDRLLDIVRRNRKQSLAAISSQVMLALEDWIGGKEQPDDITLVLARQL